MRNKLVQKMCIAAIFTAMAYVLTAFLMVPYGSEGGYFNFGDIFIYLGAILLGPWYGAFIGAVAGSMGDLTVGAMQYIPFTLVAKVLMAVSAGYLFKIFPKYLKILPMIIGGILMALTYVIANGVYYGFNAAWLPFAFDLAQVAVSVGIAYLIYIPVDVIYKKKFATQNAEQ